MSPSLQLNALRDLVAALDRRIRQPGRASEAGIALAAADLKHRALAEMDLAADSVPARSKS